MDYKGFNEESIEIIESTLNKFKNQKITEVIEPVNDNIKFNDLVKNIENSILELNKHITSLNEYNLITNKI